MVPANPTWPRALPAALAALLSACATSPPPLPPPPPPTLAIAAPAPPDPLPAPPPDVAPPRPLVVAVATIDLSAVRDGRRFRDRPRALIVTEIQALERMFTATPPSAPDRPGLMRRLAEEYEELARTAER